jgi:hypothetical protein
VIAVWKLACNLVIMLFMTLLLLIEGEPNSRRRSVSLRTSVSISAGHERLINART